MERNRSNGLAQAKRLAHSMMSYCLLKKYKKQKNILLILSFSHRSSHTNLTHHTTKIPPRVNPTKLFRGCSRNFTVLYTAVYDPSSWNYYFASLFFAFKIWAAFGKIFLNCFSDKTSLKKMNTHFISNHFFKEIF